MQESHLALLALFFIQGFRRLQGSAISWGLQAPSGSDYCGAVADNAVTKKLLSCFALALSAVVSTPISIFS
jgi:hypothetical protein